jgi:hypothetical protein
MGTIATSRSLVGIRMQVGDGSKDVVEVVSTSCK